MLPLAQRQQPRCHHSGAISPGAITQVPSPRCCGDAVLEQLQARMLPVQIPRASAVLGMRQDQGLEAALLQNPHLPRGSGWIIADVLQGVCVP